MSANGSEKRRELGTALGRLHADKPAKLRVLMSYLLAQED